MTHFETVLGKMELPDEDELALPGDKIVPDARYSYTQAKCIEAPRDIIWQYLMQLGCDRAGWYSIDLLDHDGEPSVNHLVKCWDTRNVGDKLAATPDDKDGFFDVYAVNRENYFVIGGHGQQARKRIQDELVFCTGANW